MSTVAFEREVSIESHPVLKSHVIKGKAVVPAALMVEWLAHGAMHENPGLLFHGLEEFRVLKGITLERRKSLTLQVYAAPATHRDGFEFVSVELRGGAAVHARGTVILASALPSGKASALPGAEQAYSSTNDAIYSDGRLFHGTAAAGDQVGGSGVVGGRNCGRRVHDGTGTPGGVDEAAAAVGMDRRIRWRWMRRFRLMILWCLLRRWRRGVVADGDWELPAVCAGVSPGGCADQHSRGAGDGAFGDGGD